jgi:YrbI family 3-deoxy-D-manno-octulosonate 8-phosphate phosphatase
VAAAHAASRADAAGLAAPGPARTRRVLAVIPARGGSKGVPGKNLAPVGGVPLVARAVRACLAARLITDVAVSTDDHGIAAAARAAGADVVGRPAEIAGDTATSEAAVLHTLDAYAAAGGPEVEVVMLVQCTSPFLTARELDDTAAAVLDGGADSALTAAPFHGFVWRGGTREPRTALAAGGANHDPAYRPRRQDREPELLETGAAYAMRAAGFRAAGHRFFGRTALVPTDPERVLEIDEPGDLARARALAPLLDADGASAVNDAIAGIAANTATTGTAGTAAHVTDAVSPAAAGSALPTRADVDAVVLDFDGTQTDDRVTVDADGRETVTVHRGDGLGIAALRDAGLPVLILSTETNPVVAARARKLRVPVVHGVDRKDAVLRRWCAEHGVDPARVLYAGNDVNDLGCLALVGWPVAVAGAHPVVRAAARAVTGAAGGFGAIREIAGWLLGPTLGVPQGTRGAAGADRAASATTGPVAPAALATPAAPAGSAPAARAVPVASAAPASAGPAAPTVPAPTAPVLVPSASVPAS